MSTLQETVSDPAAPTTDTPVGKSATLGRAAR